MARIDIGQIHKLVPHLIPEYDAAFAGSNVDDILGLYQISNSNLRVCHFIAQIFAETGGLRVRRESLNYSAARLMQVWPKRFPTQEIAEQYAYQEQKLGNYVYGGRLGNVDPGDGYLYRGRGLLQITGREAYRTYGQLLSIPLEAQPDLAFDPSHCLEIAAAEWSKSGYSGHLCNDWADRDNIEAITYAINGGQNGIDDRRFWLKKTKAIWLDGTSDVDSLVSSRALANQPLTDNPPPTDSGSASLNSAFAKQAINIAVAQWEQFGRQTYDLTGHAAQIGHKEGEDPWYRYVAEYWKEGVNNDTLTGLDDVPWSAAFISYVMRSAGAGTRFVYSPQHSVYIFRAIRDLLAAKQDAGYWCYQLREWKPQIGDLVCWARQGGIDYSHQNGGDYPGHCDLVVDVGASQIEIIGGNVGNSVTRRPLALNSSGHLDPMMQNGELLFGIMRCRI